MWIRYIAAAVAVAITFVLMMVLKIHLKLQKKFEHFPPGPNTLQLLMNIFQIGHSPHKQFTKMKETYGNMFSLDIFGFSAIVLNDAQIIREALSLQQFSGRIILPALNARCDGLGNKGISFNEGKPMTEQKRFLIKTLRDFGFGKKSLHSIVENEVDELMQQFMEFDGLPFQPQEFFCLATVNSLWQIVAGKRFQYDEKALTDLAHHLSSSILELKFGGMVCLSPTLCKIAPKITGYEYFINGQKALLEFARKAYEEHAATFSMDQEPRDYLDCHIKEIIECKDPRSSFYEKEGENNLLMTLSDVLFAGTDTMGTCLQWIFLFVANYPIVQEKLYEEITNIVGIERRPTIADRPQLPYAEATLMEILRLSSPTPFGLVHRTTKNVKFRNYMIPKDTLVVPNFYCVHHDPKIWGDDAMGFRPERFIDSNNYGNIDVEMYKSLMPWSTGKRICPAELLAKDILFLVLTAVVQKFEIQANFTKQQQKLDEEGKLSCLMMLMPKEKYEYVLRLRTTPPHTQ